LWQHQNELHIQAHAEIAMGAIQLTPETAVGSTVVFYVNMALKLALWSQAFDISVL